MMSAQANSLQKPERFDKYLRKFQSICEMHSIQIGSAADLPIFMQKLIEDKHLAMDFWNFVGKMSDRDGSGELSNDRLLAVIVEGVTGSELNDENRELKPVVDDLRAMISGVDIQASEQIRVAPFPKSGKGAWQRAEELRMQADELPMRRPDSRAAFTSELIDGEANSAVTLPPQLDEALHRLEQTSLELKHHLENIDKKMSQLEPHLDASSPGAPDGYEGTRWPAMDPAAEATEQLAHKPLRNSRLVLEHAPMPMEDSLLARGDDLRIPLADYSRADGHGRPLLFLLLLVALVGSAFALYRYRTPVREKSVTLFHEIQSRVTGASVTPSASPNSSPEAQTSAQPPEQNQTPPQQPLLQGTSTPPPAIAGDQTPLAKPQAKSSGFASDTRRPMTDHASLQAEHGPPDGISQAEEAGAVRVAPSVMESNLIISRVPAYPESAKAEGVQGSVVMQVIISTDGLVKHVSVIRGDPRLRSAATDAVYKWRYRPYLLNGRPVDVATTVTVDFDLD